MSKVFISHKSSDSKLATSVALRVKNNGLDTYLDTIDDALLKDGPDLAEILLARMGDCQQLIAVVSSETKGSWWVPWEIGVGSEKGFRMASFSMVYVDLPSYLKKWPELHSDVDVDLYCQYSKAAENKVSVESAGILTEARRLNVVKANAKNFHSDLKARLRRGY